MTPLFGATAVIVELHAVATVEQELQNLNGCNLIQEQQASAENTYEVQVQVKTHPDDQKSFFFPSLPRRFPGGGAT